VIWYIVFTFTVADGAVTDRLGPYLAYHDAQTDLIGMAGGWKGHHVTRARIVLA
jgi:hypothetical protein